MPQAQWKKTLSPDRYKVLRQKGTEAPFSGNLLYNDKSGQYACGACGATLFSSKAKYESNIPGLQGWPSFSEAAGLNSVEYRDDNSHGMRRTEVICKKCGSHLGHVFDDESSSTGKHYCINSVALDFHEDK
ncbi:MAG: peptide-methionine (R)-S-oxide reductase MsrB [Candidatus Saccharimonadales bacterium]